MENKLKILLVEDENPAAQRLEKLLAEELNRPYSIHRVSGVAEGLQWLKDHPVPDLLFLDINLSDGTGFKFLRDSGIKSPVIFTTAYDQYALEAFQVHSIDYLLKPVKPADLKRAMEKFDSFKLSPYGDIQELLNRLQKLNEPKEYLKAFIIKIGSKLKTVAVGDIAYIASNNRIVSLTTVEGAHYALDETLDDLEKKLNPEFFFRINRSTLLHRQAIENMVVWTKSRLKLDLKPATTEEVLVSYERTGDFKDWIVGGKS